MTAVEKPRINSLPGGRLLWSLRDGEDAPPGFAQRGGAVLEGGAFVRGHVRVEHQLYAADAGASALMTTARPRLSRVNTFTPDLYMHYFRDLRDMIAGGRPPSAKQIAGVMARYATEPATGVR